MAYFDDALAAAGYYLRLEVTEGTPNVPANTSPATARLYIQKGSGFGKYTGAAIGWSVAIGSYTNSGSLPGYDFGDYDQLTLWSGTITVAHNPDGTKTIAVSGAFSESDPAPELGDGYVSGTVLLTTIPRFGKRFDGTAEIVITTARRWDGTTEIPLTQAYRWDGTQEVRIS